MMDGMEGLCGTVSVPTSKSILARLMVLGALSDGKCVFRDVSMSRDSEVMLRALRDLGFSINYNPGTRELKINGTGGEIPKKKASIYVGEAGTAARFLTALLGLSDGEYTVNASVTMCERPMKGIFDSLTEAGAEIVCAQKDNCLPAVIYGKRPKKPVKFKVDVSQSTQFASGLMLIKGILPEGSSIETVNENRNTYINLTEQVMNDFKPRMKAEGDWASAAYIAAAVFIRGGSVTVDNISLSSDQADLKFVKTLESRGLSVSEDRGGVTFAREEASVDFGGDIEIDMSDFSDQALTMAALSVLFKGTVTIKNIGHIRKQECDRISAIKENMDILGIECEEGPDFVTITGGKPHGGQIRTHGDHRVAMAFSLLSPITDGLNIDNRAAVSKSFPDYYKVMETIGFFDN